MSLPLIIAYALASVATAVAFVAVIGAFCAVLFCICCCIGNAVSAIAARVNLVRALGVFFAKHADKFAAAYFCLMLLAFGFSMVYAHGFPPGVEADSQLLPPLRQPEPEVAPVCP